MDPITSRKGPWTITHVPAGASAYDRVIGRITPWSMVVAHDSGWSIVEDEGAPTARIVTPAGLLVGVIRVAEYADVTRSPLTTARSDVLSEALTAWTSRHAAEFDEPGIAD